MNDTIGVTPDMLARAVEATTDGVYITDKSGRILFANRAILDISGYTAEEFVGSSSSIFRSGLMSSEYYARLWNTVLSGEVWREVITNRRANGEIYEASQTISPVVDEAGDISMLIAVQRDISREHGLAQELRQTQTVVERLLEEKETLLKEVYHRVKNDLLLTRSLLEMQAAETDTDDSRVSLERAASRTGVLARIYELLQSQGEANRLPLSELMNQLVDALRISTIPDSVELTLTVDPIMVSSRTATAISMVAHELITNAVKYAFAGVESPRLALIARREGEHAVTIEVSDNGPGLPPRVIDDRQLGFGLTIASTLAAQHDGTLTFRNDGGAVVTVSVRLGS